MIAVNQEIADIQGYRVRDNKSKMIEIWARPLHDGSLAVGLFNLSDAEQEITIDWNDLLKVTATSPLYFVFTIPKS